MKRVIEILIPILVYGLGWCSGFWSAKPIQHDISEVVHDTIYNPTLVTEYRDSIHIIDHYINSGVYQQITNRIDTFYLTKIDTVKIVQDWETTRQYTTELFDISDFGRCDVSMELEFNRVNNISYNLERYDKKLFPVVGATALFNNTYLVNAGAEYNSFIGTVSVGYHEGFLCGLSLLYKF